ncbi:MAG: 30S ribosomal protein S15 [Candidatus Nanoarchaeia archaeon]|nr:30S ribosomal protein S15 [Candidatus Nanoarchaeia archaeon]
MARMHARKKGKAGSKKPVASTVKTHVKLKQKDIESLILKLRSEGKMPSTIGRILRDQYGVPSTKEMLGKRINEVLLENKKELELPEDLMSLMKRAAKARKHIEISKKDMVSHRGIRLIESKIARLVKYYRGKGKLPKDWRYSPEKAKLLIE